MWVFSSNSSFFCSPKFPSWSFPVTLIGAFGLLHKYLRFLCNFVFHHIAFVSFCNNVLSILTLNEIVRNVKSSLVEWEEWTFERNNVTSSRAQFLDADLHFLLINWPSIWLKYFFLIKISFFSVCRLSGTTGFKTCGCQRSSSSFSTEARIFIITY